MVQQYGNQYGVSQDEVLDPDANALMGAQLLKNNSQALQNAGFSNPTPGQLYVTHFMGTSGGISLLQAAQNNPNADASTLFPAAAAANPSIFAGKTVGEVSNNLQNKMNAKAAAYGGQNGGITTEGPNPTQDAPCVQQNAASTTGGRSTNSTGSGATAGTGTGSVPEPPIGTTASGMGPWLRANGQTLDPTTSSWCGATTAALTNQAGLPPLTNGNSNVANAWQNYGMPATGPIQQNDIIVQTNGLPPGAVGGHVGVATGNIGDGTNGGPPGYYEMTSGNYNNQLSVTWVPPGPNTVVRRASVSS